MAKTKQEITASSPISILWDRILLIPIFGTVDSRKAQELMEDILTKIVETESKIIIIDILGVATVDSAVANHLVKITKATTLMGCGCIISGISPAIAQTLVHLGVELEGVITRATLRDALQWAFRTNGLEVKEAKEPAVFRKKESLL